MAIGLDYEAMKIRLNNKLRFKEKLVLIPLYAGTALLIVNQRIGWEDTGGPNLLFVVLRSDLWFAIAIVLGLILIPGWTLSLRKQIGAPQSILLIYPVIFMAVVLCSSAFNGIANNVFFSSYGALDFVKMLGCFCLGLLVFNLSLASSRFASTMVNLFTWMPLMNIIVGVFVLTTSINQIEGFNNLSNSGFVGYGARFQGLGSNPNIVMTQSSIALALLFPKIMQRTTGVFLLKIFYYLYAFALIAMIAWTGVRAALVILPTVLLVLIWLRFRPDAHSLQVTVMTIGKISIFVIIALIIVWNTGLYTTLLGRLGTDNGRIFLWVYYTDLLFKNPLGFGLGFEDIIPTGSIIAGLRLPPHNILLQAGMYGGYAGVIVTIFLLGKVGQVIVRLRRSMHGGRLSDDLLGVLLAWCALLLSLIFGGLISTDFDYAILTALLLALAVRPMTPVWQRNLLRPQFHG